MTGDIIEFVDLHCKEGGSDKAYHAAIREVEGGFEVPFAYGRVGSTLATGCKTSAPVPMDKARKVYEKLVAEKTGKGYLPSPGISGNVFGIGIAGTAATSSPSLATATKNFTSHRPQLLNPISEEEAAFYINSPLWGAQEKKDGERRAVRSTVTSGIEGINRKGQLVPLHPELLEEIDGAGRCCLIDGEVIGNNLHVFDLLDLDSNDLRHLSYSDRFTALYQFCVMDSGFEKVQIVPLATTAAQKQALFNHVKASGGEGIVFKRLDAPYTADRPASGGNQLKCKFWEQATCVVVGINDNRRSVQLAATTSNGTVDIPVGNVTIPPNYAIPSVGDLVEIRYLYYYPSGSLYQPQYEGVRSDVDRVDCDIAKLKAVQEFKKAA